MSAPDTSEVPDGFPDVPALWITDACLGYMARRTEHREFNALYHEMAGRAIRGARKAKDDIYRRYRTVAHYYLGTYLCALHDMILQYFEDVTIEVGLVAPRLILRKAESPDLIGDLKAFARRKAAGPLPQFLDYINDTISPLNRDGAIEGSIVLLPALRNLIVHNDSLPDDKFIERTAGTSFSFTELPAGRIGIDELWLNSQPNLFERMIFEFDRDVVVKYDLAAHFRYGVFWYRSMPLPERPE